MSSAGEDVLGNACLLCVAERRSAGSAMWSLKCDAQIALSKSLRRRSSCMAVVLGHSGILCNIELLVVFLGSVILAMSIGVESRHIPRYATWPWISMLFSHSMFLCAVVSGSKYRLHFSCRAFKYLTTMPFFLYCNVLLASGNESWEEHSLLSCWVLNSCQALKSAIACLCTSCIALMTFCATGTCWNE